MNIARMMLLQVAKTHKKFIDANLDAQRRYDISIGKKNELICLSNLELTKRDRKVSMEQLHAAMKIYALSLKKKVVDVEFSIIPVLRLEVKNGDSCSVQ